MIPDNTTVTRAIAVDGFVGVVLDVDVAVDITHSWDGDVSIAISNLDDTGLLNQWCVTFTTAPSG